MQPNKYKKMSAKQIVELDNQKHLITEEKKYLTNLLQEFEDLFLGKPGVTKGIEVNFELKEDAKQYYEKPYNVSV